MSRTIWLAATSPPPSASTPSYRVLVIEDDPLLLESLVELLALHNLTALGASTGREGIDKTRELLPDCVLIDLTLPDMTGYAVLKQLKREPATTEVPYVIVSGYSGLENQELALELGAAAYITKPFDTPNLINTIRQVIGRR